MADLDGISFIRTTRGATPVIYDAGEEFPVGGAKVAREGDDVTIAGAGITLHEALKAADALAEQGTSARVIDVYSLKPIDGDTLREAVDATHGRIVVVEDHWPEGGLGEAVLAALAGTELQFTHLAVREMPTSGKPAELLAAAGIDADAIATAAQKLVSAAAVARRMRALAARRSCRGDRVARRVRRRWWK
jgi:transketolase